jgi:hypothetical protein
MGSGKMQEAIVCVVLIGSLVLSSYLLEKISNHVSKKNDKK